MLFEKRFWEPIAAGEVTVTFRRWKRRQVVAGRRYRTAAGMLEVTSIETVETASIDERDALAAGYPSPEALVADLRGAPELDLYRIEFRTVDEPDPRDELAASADLTDDELAELTNRLARLDRASTHGPWTLRTLRLIEDRPAVRAGDLADEVGRDRLAFKTDVRKLKNLGLTISLDVGYRLSPRGAAFLATRLDD
jgi:hypothetical protein